MAKEKEEKREEKKEEEILPVDEHAGLVKLSKGEDVVYSHPSQVEAWNKQGYFGKT
jgi:hypothetical protein